MASRMNDARFQQTPVVLKNGTMLVVGGLDEYHNYLKSAALYNPSTEIWTTTGSMHDVRAAHTPSVLPNRKVLVSGGSLTSVYSNSIKSAELYDPSTGKWANTGSMHYEQDSHTASVLANGNVLVVGSSAESNTTDTAELYNSSTDSYAPTNKMKYVQSLHKDFVSTNKGMLLIVENNATTFNNAKL